MATSVVDCILAVVATTKNKDKVSGGAPIFLVNDEEELQYTCLMLSRVLKGMTHSLDNGIYIIVKH